jgi:predicted TIM-barrel enzyme
MAAETVFVVVRAGAAGVFVPALAGFPVAVRDLMALLPVVDINGALFEALPTTPAPTVGLLLVDPFLNFTDAVRHLRRAGVITVANYPTVQLLDGEDGRALEAVGLGFDAERAALSRFAQAGFRTLGYAASATAAAGLVAVGVDQLVVIAAPGLTPPFAEIQRAAGDRPVALHAQSDKR